MSFGRPIGENAARMEWGLVALWAVTLAVIGWAAAPVAHRLMSALPDGGAAFATPLGLVWLAWGSWAGTQLGLAYGPALGLALAVLAAAGLVARSRLGPSIGLSAPWRPSLRHEVLALGALVIFVLLRALRPAIFGAEKYMDFAFFNALLRTDTLPPEDPWLAGVSANYYYGGYLLFAGVARILAVPPEVAYNLALATVGAVVFTTAASLGHALSGRASWGLFAGVAAVVLGNLDAARQLLVEGAGFAGFDNWRSSRVVPDTINEFPFWSLLHGDLHPHVTALVIVLPLLGVVVAGALAERDALLDRPGVAAVALLLGALVITNPWDVPACLAVLGLAWLGVLRRRRGVVASIAGAGARVACVAILGAALALPFLLSFRSPSGGLGWVHATTPLVPFLTVFGALLLPALLGAGRRALGGLALAREGRHLVLAATAFGVVVVYVATASAPLALTAVLFASAAAMLLFGDRAGDVPLGALVGAAALLLAACELVFVRDAYGEQLQRMNTVFKLYFAAWILLAVAMPGLVVRARAGMPLPFAVAGGTILATLVIASLCYPLAAVVTRVRLREGSPSLDGMRYLARDHPGDAAAARWLRTMTTGRPVVLEATGDPYSYYARISSNTGLPTVLGWANHERVWRGDDPRIAARRDAVRAIYAGDDAAATAALLAEHRVRYVVVGPLERQTYGAERVERFQRDPRNFTPVFQAGETTVFAVHPTD